MEGLLDLLPNKKHFCAIHCLEQDCVCAVVYIGFFRGQIFCPAQCLRKPSPVITCSELQVHTLPFKYQTNQRALLKKFFK